MNRSVRIHHIIVFLGLTIAAGGFEVTSTQLPRPWILFAGISFSLAILAHRIILYDAPQRIESFAILGEIVLLSYTIRITGYLHLAASGRDTQMWANAIKTIIETGHVSVGGMYSASPLYFLEVVVAGLVLGPMPRAGSVLGNHYVTVLVATFLPVLLAAVTMHFADQQAGLLAAILAAAFPLYLRTATLFESEHLALTWFVLLILLAQVSSIRSDKHIHGIFMFTLLAAAWLHFFYASIFISVFAATAIVIAILIQISPNNNRNATNFRLIILIAGIFLVYHILWSSWGGHAVSVLYSIFTISIPTNVSSLFVPSTDAAGASVGGGRSTAGSLIIRYLSLSITIGLAGLGGMHTFLRPQRYGMIPVAIGTVIVPTTLFLLIAQLGYNLHFRMFYFVGTVAIVFAGVALARGSELSLLHPRVTAVVLTVLIFITVLTGPITPMGNNVDPYPNRSGWATHSSTWIQKEDLGAFTVGNESLSEQSRYFIKGPDPGFYASYPSRIIIDDTNCAHHSQIWDSNDVYGCLDKTNYG